MHTYAYALIKLCICIDREVVVLLAIILHAIFLSSFKQDWISSRDFADLLLHESR